jgi:heme/copper-type cytochrome/quinol oxidase subunit 2
MSIFTLFGIMLFIIVLVIGFFVLLGMVVKDTTNSKRTKTNYEIFKDTEKE